MMIQAYKLHHLWVDDITGVAVIHRSWKFSESKEFFDDRHEYGTREIALQKIASEKKTWLLNALETWLLHKKHIAEGGKDQDKLQNISMLLEKQLSYQSQELAKVCIRILKGRGYYEAILPSTMNNSYESSKADLDEILRFCASETANKTAERT
jgi:hypothetical protein